MSFLRLFICVVGVYSMFLLWAIAQERLAVPFPSIDGSPDARFKSALFIGTCQSAASTISSLIYLLVRRKPGQSFLSLIGLEAEHSASKSNGVANGVGQNGNHVDHHKKGSSFTERTKALIKVYFQCSLLITLAAPFGFAALAHISYPTMVLGKSCKLVPVMIMNVLLYRRKFAPHKYLVVFMVTVGITMFMGFSNEGSSKKHKVGGDSELTKNGLLGMTYLLINLALDGAINSTQDEIFAKYKVNGQQMMFFINLTSTVITSVLSVLPLPNIPVIHPSNSSKSELKIVLDFIKLHPSVRTPLAQFALTGSLGQLFIFETLQHFGSLTLVMITLTRKLFTMILSVVVYNHKLTLGQWGGAAVVFAGIGVEAWVKRRDVHAKRVMQEKEKAKIKIL
ncbi:UDP-galactose transporter [Serendipita sp. 396]|nr:UDP-galactose transporter [Serendipita sp. 396]KAG8789834.1 UDP-galactose transporter [Serendipita sp. 397]KAG8858637.1 UDP-galactose transporter [Serendipita sp. 411]KAG8879494.1 UDP-galactose transporter [Serendipita sp. 405]